ncbi:MAG: hypothetical protein AUG51_14030 [Acidobacteria bacterium 13_1_20CM_3_53_8]|nr:MAG: hypothetical protein AUG51_14030 [Acidobacteria bacterium 13_1_20CM_3_53_8]
MLEDLPIEILQQVIGHLPTASAIVNLSLANKRLHESIALDNYTIFREFVKNRFPSISCPPFWKEATRILTSRSRAWDRKAFIASACQPPSDDQFWPTRIDARQKFGFVPVIDSYEDWSTSTDKRQVIAWSAAGRLRLRITENGVASWRTWHVPGDHLPQNDILDVRLLRPSQRQPDTNEHIIVRRANGEIVNVESGIEGGDFLPGGRYPSDQFLRTAQFAAEPHSIDCMDINNASEPILAVCSTNIIQIFPVSSKEKISQPSNTYQLDQQFNCNHRKRCAKFLSDEKLAVGVQFLEGRMQSPIDIYHVTPHGLVQEISTTAHSLRVVEDHRSGRQCANAIAPLDATASLTGHPGEVFLSGWSDGIARLHDLRSPLTSVGEYVDGVDDGQILSLLPIGHERFLAGSHHNACLKTFDLRMPGSRAYSYLDAVKPHGDGPSSKSISHATSNSAELSRKGLSTIPQMKEINIFLSLHVPPARRLWEPLPRRPNARLPRYRGSIYSLSAPSASSPTVFAGIESHVIQLDFKSTDDVTGTRSKFFLSDTNLRNPDEILNLSCYERPRPGHESTDPVLLRKQVDWPGKKNVHTTSSQAHDRRDDKAEPGWDERWRLATYDRRRTSGPSCWRASP